MTTAVVNAPLCAQLRTCQQWPLLRRSSIAGRLVTAAAASEPRKLQQQHKSTSVPVTALEPLLTFPWSAAADRFCSRLLDLAWASVKFLTVPALLLSSAIELQYAVLHGKALVVPLAMLLGIALAGIMNETMLELSEQLRKGDCFPWHLIVMGLLFTLVKLPGPAYPSWSRLVLPHFANGGLWQACYLVWQSRSR